MIVEHVLMDGFMRCASPVRVEFPDRGLVLLRGENGAGKSTLIEAVSYALWGKTLRGESPWAGEKGTVTATVRVGDRKVTATRARHKGRVTLAWNDGTNDGAVFENTTKAQEALEAVIGEWDLWRRAFVFSSADAAHFSLATDSERKRLLESVLGLDRFDAALDTCRLDVRKVEREKAEADRAVAVASTRKDAASRALDDALATLETMGPAPVVDDALVERLRRLLTEAQGERQQAQATITTLHGRTQVQRAAAATARAAYARLAHDACPTCTQAIPASMRERLAKESADATRAADAAAAAAEEERKTAQSLIDELDGEIASLSSRLVQADNARTVARSQAKTRQALEQRIQSATEEVDNATIALDRATATAAASTASLAVLNATQVVLGTKGVRAHVLGAALEGLELSANAWLARIAPGVKITVAASREKKTGGVIDALTLGVEGVGGGLGYRAASAGERRRIDVAMVLALGEVAAAAHGRSGGTLFADEVFDALDDGGCELVAGALEELSDDRGVVLITHSSEVASSVNPIERWHAVNGSIKVK